MSRTKNRIAQKRKEKEQKSHLMVRGAVIVIAVMVVGFLLLQLPNSEQATFSEDGRPIWHTMELIDARTGEAFTLADFDNRNVFIKIMSPF
ncbi:MAG: hypothetical protein WBC91_15275 [Phototrophicaceae bacterium]